MPRRVVIEAGERAGYWLACHDEAGVERPEGGGRLLSEEILAEATNLAPTDVFLVSHGWKGDVPAAVEQFDAWIAASLRCPADLARLRARPEGFRPLVVGLHWPSLPWGDETIPGDELPADAAPESIAASVAIWSERIAPTDAARAALTEIVSVAATRDPAPRWAADVAGPLSVLDRESGVGEERAVGDPAGDPGFDAERDAATAMDEAAEGAAAGTRRHRGGLLRLLRQFSYWKMKQRARTFGAGGAHRLLRALQESSPSARVHAVGHSFGCIAVSAMVDGPEGGAPLARPVHSATLVQGAVSLWAYASGIPIAPRKQGVFRRIFESRKVEGPVIATTSSFDKAVGEAYPRATRIRGDVDFAQPADLPRYGAIGAFGIQGAGPIIHAGRLLRLDERYELRGGAVHNLVSDHYIRNGEGASGAHSDIAHPEVAHAMWSAVAARD